MTNESAEVAPIYERRQYKNPPIEHAVCEFRLVGPADAWNATTPSQYFSEIRDEYPVPPQDRLALPPEIAGALGGAAGQFVGGEGFPLLPAFEFGNEDGSRHIVLARNALTVRTQAPYPGWESFRSQIDRAITAFEKVANDIRVGRVGLRYINKISFEVDGVPLSEYFESPPRTPEGFPSPIKGVVARWESCYDGNEDERLIYTFASLAPTAEMKHGGVLVDLDVIRIFSGEPATLGDAAAITQELKERETEAFELTITDKLREIFDAG